MPLNPDAKKLKKRLEQQYGKEKGERVFYAMENEGKIPGKKKHK